MPVLVNSSAYLLVSHGSRDPRPQKAAVHLADLVSQRLSSSHRAPIVTTAALELAPTPLYQEIYQQAQKYQLEQLHIVPLFL
ncbi:MAG: sirohydrochlorin chelatase, partial [Spirulinaceae cyanobacterium]